MSELTDRVGALLPNAKLHKLDEDSEDVIVWGPPGTGKTTSLMTLLDAHLVAEHDPKTIMVATFTRNARKELVNRVHAKFGLVEEELPWVRTIHSIAYRLLDLNSENVMGPIALKTFGEESGYHFEGVLIQRTVDDPFGTASIQTFGDWCHTAEELRRAKLMTFAEAVRVFQPPEVAGGWNEREAARYSEAYRLFKEGRGLLDFTDMLERVVEDRLRPPVATMFIDEAQDLTPLQWAVVDMWREVASRLFVFGDDDQAIYQFAGADPAALWKRIGSQFVLSHSYRLRSAIHAEANKIISRTKHRVRKDFEPDAEGGIVRREWSWADLNTSREGSWLLLGRNRAYLEDARGALKDAGVPFRDRTSPAGIPVATSARGRAVRALLDLHAGRVVVKRSVIRNLHNEVRDKLWPENRIGTGSIWTLPDLLDAGATPELIHLISQDPFEALDASFSERSYLRAVLAVYGEAGFEEPRIELSTIHGVKGEEADHVVVSTAMTRRTFDDYMSNPDSEHRVFYVAATRAKQSLTWLLSGKGYQH